jgi:hypothetical protein
VSLRARWAGSIALLLGCPGPARLGPSRDTDSAERLVDVVDDNDAKLVELESNAVVQGEHDHFAGLTNESVTAFCARAERRLVALEHELAALRARTGASQPARLHDDLAVAGEQLTEAREDLEEVRASGGPAGLDDGRVGVSVAINRAQLRLITVRDGLSDTRM